MRSFSLVGAAALLSLVAIPDDPRAGEAPAPVAQASSAPQPDLHAAPAAQIQNAPPEAQLTPPPDSEKAQATPGYVEVENPAFPFPQPPAPVVPRGRKYERADLQPYFAEGPLAQAKAELDAGRYARARELLAGQGDALPVRYLRALASLHAGDAASAAEEMERLATEYPAVADRCMVHGGVANEESGRWDAAAALFERVPSNSKLYVDARFGLSRVRRQKGDLQGAMKALGPLAMMPAPAWGRDLAAEALIAIADLARAARDAEVEREALLTLWSGHPLSPLAVQAERRVGPRIPKDALVSRGELLIEAHRNSIGMKVIEPLLSALKLPDPLACRAHFAFGKALRKERLHSRAIEVLSPVVEECKDADLRARALYVLGSSRSIVDLPHGPKTYETLVHDYPEHSFADDALFYAADLALRNGDAEAAVKRLDELAKRYPNGDFLSEALFKTFWIHRSAKRIDAALQTLDRIEQQFGKAEETYDIERAQYWRARVLEEGGKKDKAAEILEALAAAHPATYYGLMARSRLQELDRARFDRVQKALVDAPSPGAGPWPLFAGPMGEDSHFLAGVELLRLGFPEAAAAELLAVNRSSLQAEPLRLLVMVMATAGDGRSAHAVARVTLRRDLGGRITEQTRPIWEIAYPNAYRELIEKHCASASLDPDLLQALMREESALDPRALSWAGALGLTQLMPATANAVARANKLPHITQDMLLEPDWNIRLGALELGGLVKRFKGVKPFAIAGYNAGGGAVVRWQSARPEAPIDEWVEEIPISETRGYVKRVLRSYNTYQLLYARKVPVTTAGR